MTGLKRVNIILRRGGSALRRHMEKIIAMSGFGHDKYAKDLDERGKSLRLKVKRNDSTSSQSLRFILNLRMNSNLITLRSVICIINILMYCSVKHVIERVCMTL